MYLVIRIQKKKAVKQMSDHATETETPVQEVEGWMWLDHADLTDEAEPCLD